MTYVLYSDKKKVKFVARMLCAGIMTIGMGGFTVYGRDYVGIAYTGLQLQDIVGNHDSLSTAEPNKTRVDVHATVKASVTGYLADDKDVIDNKVRIWDSHVTGDVIGGRTNTGSSESNEVIITDESNIEGKVVAGYVTNSGDVHNNIVNIDSGTLKKPIFGGIIDGTGLVSNNNVIIKGGNFSGDSSDDSTIAHGIYGGYSKCANVEHNVVTIKGGTINVPVYGGYSSAGDVKNNTINIYNDINNKIYGGYSKNGNVSGNILNVYGKNLSVDSINDISQINFYLESNDSASADDTMLTAALNVPESGTTINAYMDGSLNLNNNESLYLLRGTINATDGQLQAGKVFLGVSKEIPISLEQSVNNVNKDYIRLHVNSTINSDDSVYGDPITDDCDEDVKNYSQSGNYIQVGVETQDKYTPHIKGSVYGTFEGEQIDAYDNHVKIVTGKIGKNVMGASSQGKGAMNNSVEVGAGGYIGGNVVGGYGNDQETNNKVTTKGIVKGNVYGGYMENPTRKLNASTDNSVSKNQVTVTGGQIAGKVIGGFADNPYKEWADQVSTANANTNKVAVTGGTIGSTKKASEIIGGRSLLQRTSGNKVEVSGGTVYANIFGGKSGGSGVSSKNAVTIKNGSVHGNVYGGYSNSGSVSGNLITLYRGISGNIYGGYSKSGRVSGNTLAIRNDGVTAKGIYNVRTMNFYLPKDTKNGDTMLKSHVVVPSEGTTVNAYASGGLNLNNGNSVYLIRGPIDTRKGKLNKGTLSLGVSKNVPVTYKQVTKNTSGDYVKLTFGKSSSSKNNSSKNNSSKTNPPKTNPPKTNSSNHKVSVTKGTLTKDLYGGHGYGVNTQNNTVTVNGGTLTKKIIGGLANDNSKKVSGYANNNTVYIKKGKIGSSSKPTSVSGGYSVYNNADKNKIEISGGTSYGKFVAGKSENAGNVTYNTVNVKGGAVYGSVGGGESASGTVSHNSVTVKGGTIKPLKGTTLNVFGGYSKNGAVLSNTVNLYQSVSGNVYGGYSVNGDVLKNVINLYHSTAGNIYGGKSEHGTSDNTLNVRNRSLSAKGIYGVKTRNFYLPKEIKNGDIMLKASQNIQEQSTVNAYAKNGVSLKTGDSVYLAKGPIKIQDGSLKNGTLSLGLAENIPILYHHLAENKSSDYIKLTIGEVTNSPNYVYSDNTYGGYSFDSHEDVAYNYVSIKYPTSGNIIGGGNFGNTFDSHSTASVHGNSIDFNVYDAGGYREENWKIAGGVSNNITVKNNEVDIRKGVIESAKVYGGYSINGDVKDNSVNVSYVLYTEIPEIRRDLLGGYSKHGNATENTVTVSLFGSDTIYGSVYGGYSTSGDALYNVVDVTCGEVGDSSHQKAKLIGGLSKKGNAIGNKVFAKAGSFLYMGPLFVWDNVIGGDSGSTLGTVSDNRVTLGKANVYGSVIGGRNYDKTGKVKIGSVHNNMVTLTNGAYYNHEGEGASKYYIAGGEGWNVPTYSNHVVISGDDYDNRYEMYNDYYGQSVYGGKSYNSNADKNTITFKNGVVGTLYGGYSVHGNVTGNKVTFSDGAPSALYGGYSRNGKVSGNQLNVSGRVLGSKLSLFGGYGAGSGKVTANTVNVKSDFSGTVYGGYSSGNGAVTNNRVNLYHSVNADIIGGYSKKGKVSGNTLGVQAVYNKTLTAKTISNIKNLNFYLPNNTKNGLTVLKANFVVPKEGTTVNMYANGGLNLKTGNSVYLLKGKIDTKKGTMKKGKIYLGVSKKLSANYTQQTKNSKNDYIKLSFKGTGTKAPTKTAAKVESVKKAAAATIQPTVMKMSPMKMMAVNNSLSSGNEHTEAVMAEPVSVSAAAASLAVAKNAVDSTQPQTAAASTFTDNTRKKTSANVIHSSTHVTEGLNPQTKSFVETSAFTAAMVADAANRLINDGMKNAASVVEAGYVEGDHGFVPYLVMSDNDMRYNTGSHIESDGWGLNGGLARKFANKSGEALVGVFAEHGSSDYDSYLDSGVHGSGDGKFTGGGIFAKQSNHNGFYYEGSLRAGRVHGTYTSNDFAIGELNGIHERFDYHTGYEAFHVGVGKMHQLTQHNVLDTYMRYLYSHQNDFNAGITTGETYHFDDVTSSRLVVGTRLTHAVNPWNNVYVGVGYQYEFDGDALATYDGDSTLKPSLHGSSGMMELGWQVKPVRNHRLR